MTIQPGYDILAEDVLKSVVPVGTIVAWLKTYHQKATGTNDSTAANQLIDSNATFQTAGIVPDMIVWNQTDNLWSYVVSVDSETQITLADDIFTATGKTYQIFATPKLKDGWMECNGQTVDDPESPYYGATLPDLNGATTGIKRFLRGSTTSGGEGGQDQVTHDHLSPTYLDYKIYDSPWGTGTGPTVAYSNLSSSGGSTGNTYNKTSPTTISTLPSYYEVVWIIKVKQV